MGYTTYPRIYSHSKCFKYKTYIILLSTELFLISHTLQKGINVKLATKESPGPDVRKVIKLGHVAWCTRATSRGRNPCHEARHEARYEAPQSVHTVFSQHKLSSL